MFLSSSWSCLLRAKWHLKGFLFQDGLFLSMNATACYFKKVSLQHSSLKTEDDGGRTKIKPRFNSINNFGGILPCFLG